MPVGPNPVGHPGPFLSGPRQTKPFVSRPIQSSSAFLVVYTRLPKPVQFTPTLTPASLTCPLQLVPSPVGPSGQHHDQPPKPVLFFHVGRSLPCRTAAHQTLHYPTQSRRPSRSIPFRTAAHQTFPCSAHPGRPCRVFHQLAARSFRNVMPSA